LGLPKAAAANRKQFGIEAARTVLGHGSAAANQFKRFAWLREVIPLSTASAADDGALR
jgi:hypothetical protein